LISAVLQYPAYVGIGIDESTAIIVKGGNIEVMGKSSVLILDARNSRNNFFEK
jgi:cyanophycinase